MDKVETLQVEKEWQNLLKRLPENLNLDKTAYDNGALIRKRKVKSAKDLLRLIFGYSLGKLSLRSTAGWAASIKVADISDVALLGRFKKSRKWLKAILSAILTEHCKKICFRPYSEFCGCYLCKNRRSTRRQLFYT